jgi:hypothetical protein
MGIWVVLIILSEAFIDLYVKNRVKKHYERLEETGGEKNLPPVLSHKGFIRVTRPYKNPGAILGFFKKEKGFTERFNRFGYAVSSCRHCLFHD